MNKTVVYVRDVAWLNWLLLRKLEIISRKFSQKRKELAVFREVTFRRFSRKKKIAGGIFDLVFGLKLEPGTTAKARSSSATW
jgi:hypothetical protein